MSARAVALALVGLLIGVLAKGTRAADDLDSVLDGFDDAPAASSSTPPPEPLPERFWEMSGEARLGGSVNYAHAAPNGTQADYRGLSRLQAGLRLTLDLEWGGVEARIAGQGFRDLVYPIKKREEFTHAVLQTYEADLELTEAWLRASPLERMDVKVGRQIVAWGRSDTLRVVDVLNPSDNREPGLVDLTDLRLPVAMTRVDYYLGRVAVTGIAIHESRFHKDPVPGSDFFPPGFALPGIDRPANGGDDTEWAAAVSGRFQGWDASLHWARVYEDRPRLDPGSALLAPSRITLLGATGNYALGNWLLKAEIARNRGLRYFVVPRRRFARSDVLLGFEYSGFREAMLSVDVAARRLHGFERALAGLPDFVERTTYEAAVRYSADFRNDTLHLTLLGVLYKWGEDGATYRASLEHDVTDHLSAEIGIAVYEGGDSPLVGAFDDNDRVFFTVRRSF